MNSAVENGTSWLGTVNGHVKGNGGYQRVCDQMAQTPENAIKLMTVLAAAATNKARGEARRMQTLIDQEKGGFKLEPWDWQYYAEQVRKSHYDLDQSAIRPYFERSSLLCRERPFLSR